MPVFRQHLFPIRALTLMIVVVSIVGACGQPPTKEPSAADLMPNLTDYYINDTIDIQGAIAKVGSVTSLGAAHPEITALIAGVNGVLTCYQNAGALQGRSYVNKADLTKAGIVVIANRNALTNPQTLIQCVAPAGMQSLGVQELKPCAKAYTLDKDNNQFYIAYAATYTEVCQAFCSSLQGCTP